MKIKSPWAKTPSTQDRRAGISTGMGDYYGSGIKNPVGKMRSDSVGQRPVSKKKLGTPPTSVV